MKLSPPAPRSPRCLSDVLLVTFQIANDARFAQHLKDALTTRLFAVAEETSFADVTECGFVESRDLFGESVLVARLLAKFLSFVTFLPYAGARPGGAAALRAVAASSLDLGWCLRAALGAGRMVMTVPWVTQYVAQIDPAGVTLSPYREVIRWLLGYRARLGAAIGSGGLNRLYEYLCLCWLFQLSGMRDSLEEPDAGACPPAIPRGLDAAPLVTPRLLHDSFESLPAAKSLLVEHVIGVRSKQCVTRKITPLTAERFEAATGNAPVRPSLAQRLEQSFFQNQPPSLRQMVVFAAERISSSYIKEFRARSLAAALRAGREFARRLAADSTAEDVSLDVAEGVRGEARRLVDELRAEATAGVSDYTRERAADALRLMLPVDTEEYILTLAGRASRRMSGERVAKWLSTNLTYEYMEGELMREVTKYTRTQRVTDETPRKDFLPAENPHDHTAPAPSDVLCDLQELVAKVMTSQDSADDALPIILRLRACLQGRGDIVPIVLRTCCHLLLGVITEVNRKHITPELMETCAEIWCDRRAIPYFEEVLSDIPKFDGFSNYQEKLYAYLLMKRGSLLS